MKQLHLIRHAKSSWDQPELADVDRPLAKRGIKACKLMAAQLSLHSCPLHKVYCSPAKRAQQTIGEIAEHCVQEMIWQTDQSLYTFDGLTLMQWCRGQSDDEDSLTLVGHNPALEDLIGLLCGSNAVVFPTAAYARIDCEIDHWRDLSKAVGVCRLLIKPKELKAS